MNNKEIVIDEAFIFYDEDNFIPLDIFNRRKRLCEFDKLPHEWMEYITIKRVKAKYISKRDAFYNHDEHVYPVFMEVVDEQGNIETMTLPEFRDNYKPLRIITNKNYE